MLTLKGFPLEFIHRRNWDEKRMRNEKVRNEKSDVGKTSSQ